MYQAKKRSDYKNVDGERPMNTLGVDEEDDTHEYSISDETDSQKEDASDGRCENSPQNVSKSVKLIQNSFIANKMRDEKVWKQAKVLSI